MAAFKLVYNGSKSMRWAVLTVFEAFWEGGAVTLLTCLREREEGWAVTMESERLRAAGSMSGMAKAGVTP
jgi:hypothetical protein